MSEETSAGSQTFIAKDEPKPVTVYFADCSRNSSCKCPPATGKIVDGPGFDYVPGH